MSFLIPKFTLQNYTVIMNKSYEWVWTNRWSFADIVRVLCVESFRERFALLDARRLSTDLSVWSSESIVIWWVSLNLKECIIAIKLALPTLRTTDYFFWNVWQWVHLGIDLILQKWTPIPAFQWGKVTRIKVRDGVTKNEWNCVVIQDNRGYFWWYEHLDRIDVVLWQTVLQWAQIGTCGSTGNSTQYHLHLQVDLPKTTPNPHWSTDLSTIQKKTIDPLRALRAAFSSIQDLPYEAYYQDAIGFLKDLSLITIAWGKVFPDQSLQRYEVALLLHRCLKKKNQYGHLKKITTTEPTYTDVVSPNSELREALLWLWQYGIMKGYPNGMFWPNDFVLYEQVLALLWRSFFALQDMAWGVRYQTYVSYFQNHWYLVYNWWILGKPLLRKDCFLLLWHVLK